MQNLVSSPASAEEPVTRPMGTGAAGAWPEAASPGFSAFAIIC